ncbi:hypothetical protein [Stakelama pacifica]|uniref:Uncharacterized protein n=1 Tax=Stakelama pacifica TaxID=517720 RepID=A0A4R6FSG9_9SPHN|nr:hypothetical protein [Stakelama pacifica]MAW98855.1 hypothetical protein [Sphingomonas sp.]TDN83735.1 hypothetical protein EV664_104221 [Stakelama pacifica]GGO94674.1 hypothetical protein GCM10011329_17100 [Stakelama pacifica]
MSEFPIHSASQIAILLLVLVAGWLFGLASHPGGKRWKQRYRELEAETRPLREEHRAEIAARDREIAELRAERDRLAHAAGRPVTTERDAI